MFGILNFEILGEEINKDDITFYADNQKMLIVGNIPKGYIITSTTQDGELTLVSLKKDLDKFEGVFRTPTSNINADLAEWAKDIKVFGKSIIFASPIDNIPENRFAVYAGYASIGTIKPRRSVSVRVMSESSPVTILATWQKEELGYYVSDSRSGECVHLVAQGNKNCLYCQSGFAMSDMKSIITSFEANAVSQSMKASNATIAKMFKLFTEKKEKDLTYSIESAKERIASMTEEIIEESRKRDRFMTALTIYRKSYASSSKKVKDELDRIRKFPGVESVFIVDTVMVVTTKSITRKTLVGEKEYRNVIWGAQSISVDVETGDIGITNLDFDINGKNHPHDMGSYVCLGTLSATLPALIGEYELFNVACMAIDFATTANYKDSAGSQVTQWPYLTEKGMVEVYNKKALHFRNEKLREDAAWQNLL